MTVLSLNKPFVTDVPTLVVENQLAIGAHVFRLVVVDDDGLQSDPFDATVQVVEGRTINPTLPITTIPVRPIDPIGPIEQPVNPVIRGRTIIPPRGGPT
jgi:hypothetical protein